LILVITVIYSSTVSLSISFLLFALPSGFVYYSTDLFRYSSDFFLFLFLFVIGFGFTNLRSAREDIGLHSASFWKAAANWSP
jgi:hypothetical protein